jgi:alkanesulfonate monooxygenase SsuD/methylene tetrahydromethanopterin reductase-like flavin-dependent oxidoreductase (luciferase family)
VPQRWRLRRGSCSVDGELSHGVRFGLLLSGQHLPGDSAVAAVREHLEQVELARELGFSSVWTSQHFLSHPFLYFQSVPLLARVAAAAEGMTVGTAILLLTLLNPVEVAENAATLDAIAGGRLVLGVGIGYRAVENAAFGVAQRRADLFERKLDILRRLLHHFVCRLQWPGMPQRHVLSSMRLLAREVWPALHRRGAATGAE